MPDDSTEGQPEYDPELDEEDGQDAILARSRIQEKQHPTEDREFREAIITYFRDRYARKLSAEEADRLVPAVRRKMVQLDNVDRSGVREAISHVLQLRILKNLPLVPMADEV